MRRTPHIPRAALAVLGVALVAALLWQLPRALNGPASSDGSASPAIGVASSPSLTAAPSDTPPATPTPTPTPTATATATPGPTPTNPPVIPVAGASWQPDPVLAAAKAEGRVTIDSAGQAVILDVAPPARAYPAAAALDTRWTGLIQEPPRTGVDDKGTAYTDYNYSLFCGAGTATVVLYYWPAAHNAVTTKAGYFVEPVNLGANKHARTYWKAQGLEGYGRGMILYLAVAAWPEPDRNQTWWPRPGLMNWDAHPPSTYVQNLVDGINWEASGASRLNYFYVIVPASQLTATALRDHVHADIGLGVPVVIAARTSDGTHSLPNWSTKPAKSAVNHFVSVVGYDDAAGTYTVMDTCGITCNDRNMRAGVRTISQANLFSLIQAEVDDDGIMW
ncbi:MAG: hypothetical protein ABSC46_00900 [Candidatus Limnocylindrales bacterium]